MATTTYVETTTGSNNTQKIFTYPFPALKTEDVKVALNGVTQTTGYTATLSPAQVEFDTAPGSYIKVRVYRDTDVDSAKGVYAAGSSIRAFDLNNNQDQALYALQEEQNQKGIFEEIKLDDDVKIKLGNSDDFTIYWKGSTSDAILESDSDIYYKSGAIHRFEKDGNSVLWISSSSADFKVHVKPWSDDTYDLGSSSYQWKDLYIDGTAYLDSVDIDAGAIDGTTIGANSAAAGTFTTGTIATADINGGTIDGTHLGTHAPASGNFTTGTIATADINGGAIDGTTIGASSASTGAFTTLTTSSNATVTGLLTAGDFQLSGSGKVASDLIPNVHANYDLGATNIRWGNAYVNTANVNDITGGAVITTGTSTSDTKVYSAKRCDELYYNIGTTEEIVSGEAWVSDDAKVATTAAIDARIIDLVDDVGGFIPIAHERDFPNSNPDVNDGAGTLISVPLVNTWTADSNGRIDITQGTRDNSNTVRIVGAGVGNVYTVGFGIIVETTTTEHEYAFHRYVPKATEVTTVAGSITNVNTVAGNNSNINTVAGISGNVTTVAGVAGNVTTVAGVSSNVTTVAGSIANVNTTAGSISNVNTTAGSIANVNTTAGSIANVNTTAGSIANVNTVGNNIANVNTVAGIDSDVTAVAGDAADIGACSTNIGNIAAIGSDLANNFENIKDYGSLDETNDPVTSTSGTSDITTVANSITNVNTVAGKNTEIGRLGTADAVADMALLGTTACVADMAILGTADVVSDLNTLATADVVSDMNTLATAAIVSDLDTLADISANITTVSDNKDSVTTCAGNISNINSASTHAANALTYRNQASAILTQVDSAPYNLADSVSTHTAWGEITDTGANAVFTNESSNTLLTMAEGSSNYNYGSIT